jgi:PAS domain S-box-containing protein
MMKRSRVNIPRQKDGDTSPVVGENVIKGVCRFNPDGRLTYVDLVMAQLFGYGTPAEMLQSITEGLTQFYVDQSVSRGLLERLREHGRVEGFEARHYRKDGRVIWTCTNGRAVQNEAGQFLYFEGLVTDITSRKQAEFASLAGEEMYRALVEHLPAIVFLDSTDELESTLYISPKVEELLGYTPDEWIGRPDIWETSLHPDDRERVLAEDERTRKTDSPFQVEYRLRRKDGEYIWVREASSVIRDANGTPIFWQGFLLDISEQKQAENEILESEAQFRHVFRSNPVASTIATFDEGRFIDANQAYFDLSGYQPGEVLGHRSIDLGFITEARRKEFVTRLGQEKSIKGTEGQLFTKDGRILNTLEFYELIRFGGRDCVLASFHDITGRVTALRALQESEERYRLLVDALPEAIFVHLDGRIVFANPAAMQMLGAVSADQVIGQSVFAFLYPAYREFALERIRRALETGEPLPLAEEKLLRLDGSILDIEITSLPIQYSGKKALQVLARDITERKKAEAALRESEAMLRRQVEELTILHRVALAASTAQGVDELIERVTDIIGDSLYPDNCGVELVTERGDAVVPHPSYRGAPSDKARWVMPVTMGVTGKVVRTGQAIRLGDVKQEPAYFEATPGVQSELCVPVKIGREVIGAINVESRNRDAYNEADERLLNTIAGNLATAIEKLRLLESEQKRRREAELLREATASLTTSLDLQKLYDAILENLGAIVSYDSATITLVDEGDLVIVAERNLPKGYDWIGKRFPGSAKWAGIFESHKPLVMPDAQVDPRFESWEGTDYIHGWMGVPLIAQGKVIGLLNLDSRTVDAFSDRDAVIAQTFGNQAAVAIHNALLFAEEQAQRQRTAILLDVMRIAASSLALGEVMQVILERLSVLVPSTSGTIQLLEGEGLKICATAGYAREFLPVGEILPLADFPLNAKTIKERIPVYVADVTGNSDYIVLAGLDFVRAFLSVPLIYQGQAIGLITLDSMEASRFDEADIELALAVARHAAIAIENARLFEAEKKRRQEAETLQKAMAVVTTTLDQEMAIDLILEQLSHVVTFDSASVQLLRDGYLEIVGGRGDLVLVQEKDRRFPFPGDNPNTVVLQQRQPLLLKNAPEAYPAFLEMPSIQAWLGVPLIVHDRPIGILTLDGCEVGHFTAEHAQLVSAFANQAAIAIENARLFEAEQERRREAEILRQASAALASSLELKEVLDVLLQQIAVLIPYNSAAVFMQEGDHYRVVAGNGFSEPGKVIGQTFPLEDELASVVRETRQPIVSADIHQDPRFHGWGDSDNVHGWMCFPLIARDQVIGHLTIDSFSVGAYDASDAELAMVFANQAASAIQNAHQFEIEQRHFREAESLRITAESIASSLDVRQVLTAILHNLGSVISYDRASIFLLEGDRVRLTAARGLPQNDAIISMTFPASNALLQETWKTRQPLILVDAQNDPRFEKWVTGDTVHGWMGVPLISRGEIMGCITIDSYRPGTYNEHDALLAMTFAHQAAAAIENARLYERSEKQVRQLTVLRDIDTAISSSFDLKVTLNILLGHALKELGVDAAAILLYTPSLQALTYYTSAGFSSNQLFPKIPIQVGTGWVGQVALQRKLIHITDLPNQPTVMRSPVSEERFQDYFGIPLVSKGQLQGVLELYTCDTVATDSDWLNFLHTLAGQAGIAIDSAQLFKNLQRSNQELILAYDTTLEGWGKALELRDKETQGHTQRVAAMTIELARRLGVEREQLAHIMRGTLLHDIGKMGIPDQILHKPGPLTDEEWEIMRLHPQYAYDLLSPIPYLRPALDIPYCHHERWDGSGYPRGLKGEEIPLAARIFAVVDVWDALLYDRPYRQAWELEKVIEYIRNKAGTELDPKVVEMFLWLLKEKNT